MLSRNNDITRFFKWSFTDMSLSLIQSASSSSNACLQFQDPMESVETWGFLHASPTEAPELHTVVDAVLARINPDFRHIITTRPCKSDLYIRMQETVLVRVVYALLRGLHDARTETGLPLGHLLISTRKCLNGFGAALELIDDGPTLPRNLLFQLSQMETSPIRETPGWHLLVARDLVETHGGRLLVQSPPRGLKTGAALRLFLPLSTSQQNAAGSSEREEFHVAV